MSNITLRSILLASIAFDRYIACKFKRAEHETSDWYISIGGQTLLFTFVPMETSSIITTLLGTDGLAHLCSAIYGYSSFCASKPYISTRNLSLVMFVKHLAVIGAVYYATK